MTSNQITPQNQRYNSANQPLQQQQQQQQQQPSFASDDDGGLFSVISPVHHQQQQHTSASSTQKATSSSSVWAPELNMNALEKQVDHYADEAVKAAQKIQVLPPSEINLLKAAAESNRFGRGAGAGAGSRSAGAAAATSPTRTFYETPSSSTTITTTQWRSLPSLPPYILRLLFAAGQMYQWLTKTPKQATLRHSPHKQDAHHHNVVGNFSLLITPVILHQEGGATGGREGGYPPTSSSSAASSSSSSLSSEKVVEYLTEFSEEFPHISQLELVLHEVMSEISIATTPTRQQQQQQQQQHQQQHQQQPPDVSAAAIRNMVPATRNDLLQMTPTQRAQFASDILACHRSPVVYAVRQWCFAIGRYLLLLDQWIRMRRKELQVLSRERTRQMQATERSARDEDEEVDSELAHTQRDMEETFREKFLSRGGSQLLLKPAAGTTTASTAVNDNVNIDDKSNNINNKNAVESENRQQKSFDDEQLRRRAVDETQRQQQQQQQRQEQQASDGIVDNVDVAPPLHPSPPPQLDRNSSPKSHSRGQQWQQQQQKQQQETNIAHVIATTPTTRDVASATVHDAGTSTSSTRVSPKQQQQQQSHQVNTLSQLSGIANSNYNDTNNGNDNSSNNNNTSFVPVSPSSVIQRQQQQQQLPPPPTFGKRNGDFGVSSMYDATYEQNGENDHSLALSRLHYIQDADERQRAMALVESYRQELAMERTKRQQAENENRVLRLEGSKFEAKLTDVALLERRNAQESISAMKKQLESALADATSASNKKIITEATKSEVEGNLRDARRDLDAAKNEANSRIQQLLVTNQRLESTQVELCDARQRIERSEQQRRELQRELEGARLQLANVQNTSSSSSMTTVPPNRVADSAIPQQQQQQQYQNLRTVDGSLIFAAASGAKTGQSTVIGVHRGLSPLHSALVDLQNIENSARLELEIDELSYAMNNNANSMRADLLSLVIGTERANKYLSDRVAYTERQMESLRESSANNELLESAQDDILRLRRENESLQQHLQQTIDQFQSRSARKFASDEARILALETELSGANQKLAALDENISAVRFQAADSEHRLRTRFHEEQELRVKAEIALRHESEKNAKLAAELEVLQKDKSNLAEMHRESVAEVNRISIATEISTKVLASRVQELEQLCERQNREVDDVRKQNRAINDEMAAVRRHNATLDNQLASPLNPLHPQHQVNNSSLSQNQNNSNNNSNSANNILIDALKTKIETLESRERDNNNNHQNTVAQLEQRLAKLRSELLAVTESSEHTMFELRRNLQTAQLKSDSADNQARDWQKRVSEAERELDLLRQQNRELSAKLQSNASARSDNEALKEQLRYVEDDLGRKRDEVTVLRGERQLMHAKLQESQAAVEAAKLDHDRKMHDAEQRSAENERTLKRRAEEAIRETEQHAQRKFDQDLARVVSQLEALQQQDRELQAEKVGLSSDVRRSNEKIALLENQYQQAQNQISDMRNMIQLLQTRAEIDGNAIVQNQRFADEERTEKQGQQKQQKPHPPPPSAAPTTSSPSSPLMSAAAVPPRSNINITNDNNNNNKAAGETLETISKRVNIPVAELLNANPNIESATTVLPRGTRVTLPALADGKKGSAMTSTSDLGPATTSRTAAATGLQDNGQQPQYQLESAILRSPSAVSSTTTDSCAWNSLDDLIQKLGLTATSSIDLELLKEVNSKIVDGTDKPLPPGANVVLPISVAHRVPSIEDLRSKLNLHADGAVRLRDGPEPHNPDSPLPLGSIVNVTRSLQNPDGATIYQLALRLSMPSSALLEANPSVKDEFELIPWYKTIFVPRREDPQDALSLSWRRSRRDQQRREKLEQSGMSWSMKSHQHQQQQHLNESTRSGSAAASGGDDNNNYNKTMDNNDNDAASPSTRPPWTLEETASRCGVSFEELMRTNASAFPGTCRIPEDLLPHFIPFKFVLRPFRREVHPKRIQDVVRMLNSVNKKKITISAEDLLRANSGVSSGTSLLRPLQTIRIPCDGKNILRHGDDDDDDNDNDKRKDNNRNASNAGRPLTVAEVAKLLRLSPVEFLKDNHRQFSNLTENVTTEFFITVRDVDKPNFGDFVLQLGTIDPAELKRRNDQRKLQKEQEEGGPSKLFDRLKDAMEYGPRKGEFEDEEELEEQAKMALMKKRRNSNDYWKSKGVSEGHDGGDDKDDKDDKNATDLSASQRKAMKQNTWSAGWVSRVSVQEQKISDSARRVAELEEQERLSQSRVRHLPLLAAAAGSASSSSSVVREAGGRPRSVTPRPDQQQQQKGRRRRPQVTAQSAGTDDFFEDHDDDDYDDYGYDEVDAAFDKNATGQTGVSNSAQQQSALNKLSRPTSAAFYRLAQSSPLPLAQLDQDVGTTVGRPTSAALLRQQINDSRSSRTLTTATTSKSENKNNNNNNGQITTTWSSSLPQPPKKQTLPDELRVYLKQEVTATNKENTMQFFDFNPFKKYMNDENFRTVIELVAKKQSQSLNSVYFAGISSVAPEVVLKGVAVLAAYCNKFHEFTTDPMQFPPESMAQLRLLLSRKEELRATKWIFESSVASQRSVVHLKGKKLTDASAVLLDALDEMTARHGVQILDLRDNFLTGGTGKEHLLMILKRDSSPVSSILVDDNPEMDEVARLQIAEVAEKKEKKQLQQMAYQQRQEQQMGSRLSPARGGGAGSSSSPSPSTTRVQRPMSASIFRGLSTGATAGTLNEDSMSPTQKRFMNRFS